jgi:hypothetical protein
MKRILFFWILVFSFLFGQYDISVINRISKQYNGIEDFQGKMKVITEVPNFRMPIKTVNLFYKAPDQMKMKVKGFALLPKNGILPFMYLEKINPDSVQIDTVYTNKIDKKDFRYISISDTSIIKEARILLTIDDYLERVESVNIISIEDTLSTINFTYQNISGFWMPETTEFVFNLKKRLPMTTGPSITNPFGSIDIGSPEDHFNNQGKVQLIFSEIRLNSGIDEAIFQSND